MLMFYLAMIDEKVDRLTFNKLYTKYSDDIYKRVYGILKNKYDAEDAAQETWTAVCKNIDFYRDKDDESAKAYIIGIAKNQAFIILRRKKKEGCMVCDMDKFSEKNVSDEQCLYNICDGHDESEIFECIKEIGEPYSDVLLYYYFHEHTLKEISQIMGEKESTVGSRLTRGRAKLIQLLVRRGYHD